MRSRAIFVVNCARGRAVQFVKILGKFPCSKEKRECLCFLGEQIVFQWYKKGGKEMKRKNCKRGGRIVRGEVIKEMQGILLLFPQAN